jgi:hypothetical protein
MVFEVPAVVRRLFYTEDGGNSFLRNIGTYQTTQRYIPEDRNFEETLKLKSLRLPL